MNSTLLEVARKQLEIWGKASPEEMAEYYTDDVVLIDPTQSQPHKGKDETREWFASIYKMFGEFKIDTLKLEQIATNVIYHDLLGTFKPGQPDEYYMIFRSTVIWRQVDNIWKIHHEQWDVNPCDASGARSN